MAFEEKIYCPYCRKPMSVDSRVVSQETLLKQPRLSCVTQASCMGCVIQVTINGNLPATEQILQDNIAILLGRVIKIIPKENRPAFVTARKKELEERLAQMNVEEPEYNQVKEAIEFITKYINNEPWGDYCRE